MVRLEPADKVINLYYAVFCMLSTKRMCILICTVDLICVSSHLSTTGLQGLDTTAASMLMECVNVSSFSRWSEISVC